MLRVIAVFGTTTYYLASEPLDYDNRYWEPRIANTFELNRQFEISEKSGNRIRSMELTLDNRGQYFNAIEASSGFLNMKVTFLFKEGTKKYQKFTGRVSKLNSFGDEISLTIMEGGYEYLKLPMPDAQIEYDYYSINGIGKGSWSAIPIPFGTVERMPLAWVNLMLSEFMIGSGPLFKVRKLYFDKTLVYDVDTGKNGYKATPEGHEIKFRIFHGTGDNLNPEIVDGVTSAYPGFAYVQLYKIVDMVEEPADPVTPDGEVTQIYADLYGIRNALNTDAERNPAQILYNLMTKPDNKWEGYGLALDEAELDFADAILECSIQGFKIDGVIDNTAEFGEWVNEILRCCRGSLTEEDGLIKLTIDGAKTAGLYFDETGVNGLHCDVSTWEEPDIDSQTNRVRLNYSWNFERGDFNMKPGVHEESPILDPNLKDEPHALRIGKWNTETLEFKLIRDDTTAHKLAQYYLKNITKQLKRTSLVTEVNIGDLDAGEVITVTSPKFGWVEKEFLVTGIKRNQQQTDIELKEYSDEVYVFVDPGTGTVDDGQGYSPYNIPAKPVMNSLTVVNEVLKDGTIQTRLDVEFTKAISNVQMTALYYKRYGEPDNTFKALDFTIGESTLSAIWKGIEAGDYIFRLVSISSAGIYSDIDIEDGDRHYFWGQPDVVVPTTEVVITLEGDVIAPGTPDITTVQPIMGGVSLYFDIPDGFPDDFSHFEVYRKLGEGEITLFDENYPGQLFNDISYSESYLERQYGIIAVDTTGNKSAMSELSDSVLPLQIDTDDLVVGSVTSDIITNLQIIRKDFRTTCNTGIDVDGILFNPNGIQAWHDGTAVFDLNPTSGNLYVMGGIYETAIGVGNTVNGILSDTDGIHAWNDGVLTVELDAQSGAMQIEKGKVGGWMTRPTALYSEGVVADIDFGLLSSSSTYRVGGWGADRWGYFEAYDGRLRGELESVIFQNNRESVVSGNLVLGGSAIAYEPSGYIPSMLEEDYDSDYGNGILQDYLYRLSYLMVIDEDEYEDFPEMTYAEFIALERSYYDLFVELSGGWVYEDTSDETHAVIFINYGIDQFSVGDIIHVQRGNSEYWANVDNIVDNCLEVEILHGTKFFITSGQPIINYGANVGSGGVKLDGQNKTLTSFTHDGNPWSSITNNILIGKLDGWGEFEDVYGIAIGDITDDYLTYDSTSKTLNFKGVVNSGSTGIANFDDAGDLATLDDLDDISDGEIYFKTNANEKSGAGKAYTALDALNFLTTGVKPSSNIGNPNASGLYVGADKMGYYDNCIGSWKNYFENDGNFYATDGMIGDLKIVDGIIDSEYSFGGESFRTIIKSNVPEFSMEHIYSSDCNSCSNAQNSTGVYIRPSQNGSEITNAPLEVAVSDITHTGFFTSGNVYAMGGFMTGSHLFAGYMDGSLPQYAPLVLNMVDDSCYAISTNGIIKSANITDITERLAAIEGLGNIAGLTETIQALAERIAELEEFVEI